MSRGTLAASLLLVAAMLAPSAPRAAPPAVGTAQGEPLDGEGERPRRTVSGYPGFRLPDWQIGGTASWTADGDPPAGNRSTPAPPALNEPERTGSETGDRGNRAASDQQERAE